MKFTPKMNWPGSLVTHKRSHYFLFALGLILISSCTTAEIQITRASLLPTIDDSSLIVIPSATLSVKNPEIPTGQPAGITSSPTTFSRAKTPANNASPVPLPSAANETPILFPEGIRPDEAEQIRPPEDALSQLIEWRPPPVQVPHSLHPDDHYWLTRPLASDSRNYDLEWYTYGNEPLLPETLPYRIHHGMDFPNSTGTPIFAASSGTVIWAGPLRNTQSGVNYYGNTVVILHDWRWQDKNVYTLYAHTLELFVEVGDYVEQGQLIAGVGASGEVSGPHLHLEVRIGENSYDSTRNPALWLAPFEGWGTLAGRFVDNRGRLIHGALLTLRPVKVDSNIPIQTRQQRSYSNVGINSDDVWQENFVVADLPAGEYTLFLNSGGNLFRRNIQIKPGQTNFVVVQADFLFVPTPTSTPTLTPSPTGTLTGTLTTKTPTTPDETPTSSP